MDNVFSPSVRSLSGVIVKLVNNNNNNKRHQNLLLPSIASQKTDWFNSGPDPGEQDAFLDYFSSVIFLFPCSHKMTSRSSQIEA